MRPFDFLAPVATVQEESWRAVPQRKLLRSHGAGVGVSGLSSDLRRGHVMFLRFLLVDDDDWDLEIFGVEWLLRMHQRELVRLSSVLTLRFVGGDDQSVVAILQVESPVLGGARFAGVHLGGARKRRFRALRRFGLHRQVRVVVTVVILREEISQA